MVNLVLTSKCNRKCDYCFAKEIDDEDITYFSLEAYEETLNYLDDSNIANARLLGGEPTLHPQFLTMLDKALNRDKHVTIFTGGVLSQRIINALHERTGNNFDLLVNVIYPFEGGLAKRQRGLMKRLGPHCLLGVNIEHPGIELNSLLDLHEQYELIPKIRLGLAHPNLIGNNSFIHPKHYPEVGRRIENFAYRADEKGIKIEFDCGWTPCMFSEEAISFFGDMLGKRCSPILDILPDNTVIHCFPLRNHPMAKTSLESPAPTLRKQLSEKIESWRTATIYQRCETCNWYINQRCTGGCLAMAIRRQTATAENNLQ